MKICYIAPMPSGNYHTELKVCSSVVAFYTSSLNLSRYQAWLTMVHYMLLATMLAYLAWLLFQIMRGKKLSLEEQVKKWRKDKEIKQMLQEQIGRASCRERVYALV